ncbi:MAG: type II toxin-antitoxin system RelE/ParE family toxin [Pseudomonadota bacterium]|nr:type II toxin-antitoxin system RelE/ParE family toxin [Pseudomonadota bacterium]
MPQFRLTHAAKNDLKQIATYTKDQWGTEQRNTYLRQIDERFLKLALNPTIGKPCDYIKPGYRKSSVGSHIIFYTSESSGLINIVRILHKNSDVETKF